MQSSLSISSIFILFGTMFILAIIPGISVLAVSTRSATYGFKHGLFTTLGIAAGDVFYILLTILGLAMLAHSMVDTLIWFKYIAGCYLIWLGTTFWSTKTTRLEVKNTHDSSLLASFLLGLVITLADQKAILFYFAFFPTFINLSTISVLDGGIIILINIISLLITKLSYAYAAAKSRKLVIRPEIKKIISVVASGILITLGLSLLVFS